MKLVRVFWAVLVLYQLCGGRDRVEAKVRNRVQKWQQRTWRARFGSALRRDWKDAFEPAKTHRRFRYGLSPREQDFFSSDTVPNSYSNYHYRRMETPGSKGQRAASGRRRDHYDGRLSFASRPKRHTLAPSEELKDYLDPVDLMLLGDDPNGDFIPFQPEFGQQHGFYGGPGSEEMSFPADSDPTERHVAADGKKLKEFKIIFHHRHPSGGGDQTGLSRTLLFIATLCAIHAARRRPFEAYF